jgi:hypothetical protein
MKNLSSAGLLSLAGICLVGIGVFTALGKPVPEIYSWAAAGALCGLLGLTPPGTVVGALGKAAEQEDQDVESGAESKKSPTEAAALRVIESVMPDQIEALLPSLAPNIAAEVRRVLKRGIKL